MDAKKTQVPFQLKVLNFIQNNRVSNLGSGCLSNLKEEKNFIMMLLMYLSNKLIDEWLQTIVKVQKESLSINTSNPENSESSNTINPFIDGEVNRLVGWGLFASIKKMMKLLKNKMVINLVLHKTFWKKFRDIKVLESDILQDSEYIKRYYFTDADIRNKWSLALISLSYIVPFSKLSHFILNQCQNVDTLKKRSDNVKSEVISFLTEDKQSTLMNKILHISNTRVLSNFWTDKGRVELVSDILNRISNINANYATIYQTSHELLCSLSVITKN